MHAEDDKEDYSKFNSRFIKSFIGETQASFVSNVVLT